MIGTCRFEILGECFRSRRRRRLLAKMVVIVVVVTMMAVLTIRTDWTH